MDFSARLLLFIVIILIVVVIVVIVVVIIIIIITFINYLKFLFAIEVSQNNFRFSFTTFSSDCSFRAPRCPCA